MMTISTNDGQINKGRFRMRVADRVVAVAVLTAHTWDYCKDYLCEDEPDFSVAITLEDIAFEQLMSDRERAVEGLPARKMANHILERTALQRKLTEKLFTYDTQLFHGSVIAVDGQAYLFTAKSGTGKSTHTRLWREMLGDRAVMVNDDKPFLRVMEDRVLVYGSPWNGKHNLGTNICVPLKAVCLLERGQENEIRKISAEEALMMLFQQSSRPQQPDLLPKYMELLGRIANKAAFYRLACNMDPEAARLAYDTMSGI